jgi:DNA polymerase-4
MSGEHESTILHVDMDAFFASVTERDHPELKGKAVVIGAGVRGVVTSANYEARKFGIKAAMPVGRAQRLAPHAIFIPPDHKRYSEVSEHIMEIFHSFTPLVEPISLDEAFLDVTKARRLLGDGRAIATAIRAKVEAQEEITCSVGIASSKFIAKLASQRCKPNGILEILDDRVLTFLHPLPVSALWGVGPKTNEALERLGLHTVGDIAQTPQQTLIRALGQAAGESLYELA